MSLSADFWNAWADKVEKTHGSDLALLAKTINFLLIWNQSLFNLAEVLNRKCVWLSPQAQPWFSVKDRDKKMGWILSAILRHHNASSLYFTFSSKIILFVNTSRDFSVFRDRTLWVDIVSCLISISYLDTFKLEDQWLILRFTTQNILRNHKYFIIRVFFVNLSSLEGALLFEISLNFCLEYF